MDRTYEYGRVRTLAEKLCAAGVPEDAVREIMAGGEAIRGSTSPEAKAAWMQEAMLRMDRLLDAGTRQAVREACACCLGGKRLEMVKRIAREHATFEERLAAANEARFVFGHSVTQEEDGRLLVRFDEEGKPGYRCVCLPKAQGEVSETYCYCCGGHIKHHLQIALGRKLQCEVRSSALSSGGTQPCSFRYTVME